MSVNSTRLSIDSAAAAVDACLNDEEEYEAFLQVETRQAARSGSSSPSCASGVQTPPMAMPAAPTVVVDRDLDYVATVQHLDSKDWAMWARLTASGLAVNAPNPSADACLASGRAHPAKVPTLASSCRSDSDIFAMDL